jgi:hypothetical protein
MKTWYYSEQILFSIALTFIFEYTDFMKMSQMKPQVVIGTGFLAVMLLLSLYQVPDSTAQSTCDAETEVCINLRTRLQGITKQPEDTDPLDFVVTLNGGDLSTQAEKTVSMSVGGEGIWDGTAIFTNVFNEGTTSASDFYVTIKPPKHLKRKICTTTPPEIQDGTSACETGELTFVLGDNTLDISNAYFLAGDLPINNSEQNGIVESVDLIYIRNNIRKNTLDVLNEADLNLDKIIDSQDLALAVYTLSEDVNTDE